jgi:triosephosphate isomerase
MKIYNSKFITRIKITFAPNWKMNKNHHSNNILLFRYRKSEQMQEVAQDTILNDNNDYFANRFR